MNLYAQCFLISLIGLALSMLTVIASLTKKARVANIKFNWTIFFTQDIIIQAVGTVLTVGLGLMLLGPAIKQYPKFADNTLAILAIFATIGYIGSDIASRFFSVMNKRINAGIDEKTTIADFHTGNLDAPTVAPKPSKPEDKP